MELTGRRVMLDNLSAGIQDDEIDYLVSRIGINRVKASVNRAEATDESVAMAREKMPASLDINGVTYWRGSQ